MTLLQVDSSTKPGAVPLHTSADGAGNTVTGQTMLTETAGVATPVSPSNPVPVGAPSGLVTDASGAVPVASTLMLVAGPRRMLTIANSGLVEVWINFSSPATAGQGSFPLLPNGSLSFGAGSGFVPSDAIYAIAVGTPGALTIKVGE